MISDSQFLILDLMDTHHFLAEIYFIKYEV